MNTQKEKKKSSKKVWIVLAVVVVLFVALVAWINSLPEPEAETTTSVPSTSAVPARKGATGKSDKAISEYDDAISVGSIPDDKTGKRRIARTASTKGNFEEYAKSYYETYFNKLDIKDDEYPDIAETHFVVNFTNKTVTHIVKVPGVDLLELDVTEYTDKEELSFDTIGEGMLLAKYYVYLDNGDIEPLDLNEE